MSQEKRALFIGRWQTPYLHQGHLWCFEQKLNQGIPILIGVRDVSLDEKNPYTAQQVYDMITKHYEKEIANGSVKVFILPCDISTVCYGRGVGYEIEELTPPSDIAAVSATQIRANENKQ